MMQEKSFGETKEETNTESFYEKQYSDLSEIKLFDVENPPLEIETEYIPLGSPSFHGDKITLWDKEGKEGRIIYQGLSEQDVYNTKLGNLIFHMSNNHPRQYSGSRAPDNWTPEMLWWRKARYCDGLKELFLPENLKSQKILLPNNCYVLPYQYGLQCYGELPSRLKIISEEDVVDYVKADQEGHFYYRKRCLEKISDKVCVLSLEDFINFVKNNFTTRFIDKNFQLEDHFGENNYENKDLLPIPFRENGDWFKNECTTTHVKNVNAVHKSEYSPEFADDEFIGMKKTNTIIDGYEYDKIDKLGFSKQDFFAILKDKYLPERKLDGGRLMEILLATDPTGGLAGQYRDFKREESQLEIKISHYERNVEEIHDYPLEIRFFRKWYISKFLAHKTTKEPYNTIYEQLVEDGYLQNDQLIRHRHPGKEFEKSLEDLFGSLKDAIGGCLSNYLAKNNKEIASAKQRIAEVAQREKDLYDSVINKYFWIGQTPFPKNI